MVPLVLLTCFLLLERIRVHCTSCNHRALSGQYKPQERSLHFSFNEFNMFKHVQSQLVSFLLLWLGFCAFPHPQMSHRGPLPTPQANVLAVYQQKGNSSAKLLCTPKNGVRGNQIMIISVTAYLARTLRLGNILAKIVTSCHIQNVFECSKQNFQTSKSILETHGK